MNSRSGVAAGSVARPAAPMLANNSLTMAGIAAFRFAAFVNILLGSFAPFAFGKPDLTRLFLSSARTPPTEVCTSH